MLSKLPNIFDFPGLEDAENESLQEILELVIGGRLSLTLINLYPAGTTSD